LDKAADEFADLDRVITEMEKYTGVPYVWGKYRLLFLPPNFPYGGMENPTLTFATPFLIVGDKSMFSVAIHEIAHSWTGNLVTNMNWDNFWLNEGCTVFLERKISKVFHGDAFVKVDARVGNNSMYQAMLGYGLKDSFSSLTPRAGLRNPDDAFSTIPYEKGYQFLLYLEELDGETNFQKFVNLWLSTYKYKSADSDDFRQLFETHLKQVWSSSKASDIMKKIDWVTWLETAGLPPATANFTTSEEKAAIKLADDYISLAGASSPANYKDYNTTYKNNQRRLFLGQLLARKETLTVNIVKKINEDLCPLCSGVSGLQSLFITVGINSGYMTSPYPDADLYLGTHGALSNSNMYALIKTKSVKDANDIFAKHKSWYHPITVYLCEQALK
jgi:leukotriene-A4 hydrolase